MLNLKNFISPESGTKAPLSAAADKVTLPQFGPDWKSSAKNLPASVAKPNAGFWNYVLRLLNP